MSYPVIYIDQWLIYNGVTEVALSHFCGGASWLNIRAKYVGNGAVNQEYYNTILFLVGAPNCRGPLVFDLTLPNGRYATAYIGQNLVRNRACHSCGLQHSINNKNRYALAYMYLLRQIPDWKYLIARTSYDKK